jgi:hypothetical protein
VRTIRWWERCHCLEDGGDGDTQSLAVERAMTSTSMILEGEDQDKIKMINLIERPDCTYWLTYLRREDGDTPTPTTSSVARLGEFVSFTASSLDDVYSDNLRNALTPPREVEIQTVNRDAGQTDQDKETGSSMYSSCKTGIRKLRSKMWRP